MTEPPLFVLFVCPFPDLEGGGQRSLLLLLKHLDRSRCRPLVLTPGEGEMSRLSRELRVPVIVEKYPRLKSARVWESLFFILRLARLLRRCGPAIVHGDRPDLGLLCALAARLSGAGSVFHARVGERHRLDPLLGLLNDAVVCVSQASAERFGPGAVVVRNGADLDAFKPRGKASAKASIGIPPASPVLGFAGRLSREKGLETALRSFALVLREMPNARLVVLGRGPWGKKVPELAGELGMSGSLLFPGFTQTPELFFPALDLLLFPTQEVEGLPRVLVEAMACGVPALASDLGGNREVVSDGETGFLVRGRDPGDYAAKALLLLRDRALLAEFSQRAGARARARFDARETARRIELVYGGLRPGRGVRSLYYSARLKALRGASSLLSRRAFPARVDKILVVRNDGLGDAVLSFPFLESLRLSHPRADIACLCRGEIAGLLGACGAADRFIPWLGFWPALLPWMRSEGFSLAIDCLQDGDLGGAPFLRAGGAGFCCGFENEGRGLLLDRAADPGRGRHFTEEMRALAESIGLRPPRARPSLRLPAAALGRARDFLLSSGLRPSDRLLFLHPGGRYPAQRWPADRLARSAARTGAGIVVSAGPRESREMSAMKALLPEAVFLEGADALELASCLALCGAFAGNNSGPLHLACALGVPSLSTSGPTDRSRFDPMGEDCLVLDAADFGPGREIGQIPEEAFAEALSPIVARAKTLEERFRLAGGG